jgi:hypothetical protein
MSSAAHRGPVARHDEPGAPGGITPFQDYLRTRIHPPNPDHFPRRNLPSTLVEAGAVSDSAQPLLAQMRSFFRVAQCPSSEAKQKISTRDEYSHFESFRKSNMLCCVGDDPETHGWLMYIFIRKVTKIRSVADAARRAKSGIGQILRESRIQILLCTGWGRRRRSLCDDI